MQKRQRRRSIRHIVRNAVMANPLLLNEPPTAVCHAVGLNPEVYRGNVYHVLESLRRELGQVLDSAREEDASTGDNLTRLATRCTTHDAPRDAPRDESGAGTPPPTPPPVEETQPQADLRLNIRTKGLIAKDEVLLLMRAVLSELASASRLRQSRTSDLIDLAEFLATLAPLVEDGADETVQAADAERRVNPLRLIVDERRRAASG